MCFESCKQYLDNCFLSCLCLKLSYLPRHPTYEHMRQQQRGHTHLSACAGDQRAAVFSPGINCSWKQCYSSVQWETILKDCWNPRPTSVGLYGSILYACVSSVIETSCPGDTPASLMGVHPWSSSFGTLQRTILCFLLPSFFMSCSQKLMWVLHSEYCSLHSSQRQSSLYSLWVNLQGCRSSP